MSKQVVIDGVPYAPITQKIYTNVWYIVDESGSMGNLRNETISLVNDQFKALRETVTGEMTASLIKFNTVVNPVLWEVSIDKLEDIGEAQYRPSGYTAMFDAVGTVLERAGAKTAAIKDADPHANISNLVVIISDGLENVSKKFTAEKIASLVSEAEKSGEYTFSYVGANQNLNDVSKMLGNISTANYAATHEGFVAMTSNMSQATRSLTKSRGAGGQCMNSAAYSAVVENGLDKPKKGKV